MTNTTNIGLRLHGGLDPHRCVALARAAEANNFASVWFAENPFERGVLPAAAACAVATQHIRIGIGVWNPFNRHPSLIAMEIGALDELAEGRVSLGIGSGMTSAIRKLGLDDTKPLAALRDTFRIVRGLLRGDEVTYSGTVFSAHAAKLGYQPPRPVMPIFMAARGDQALQLCGQIADGLVVSNMCPSGFTARAADIVGQAAADAGRPVPGTIVQYVPCSAGPDGPQARRAIKPTLAAMLRQSSGPSRPPRRPCATAIYRTRNFRPQWIASAQARRPRKPLRPHRRRLRDRGHGAGVSRTDRYLWAGWRHRAGADLCGPGSAR